MHRRGLEVVRIGSLVALVAAGCGGGMRLGVSSALGSLGFEGVEGVRSGRYFQVRVHAAGKDAAIKQVDAMSARLLANPVIESYEFEIAKA